MSCALAIAPEAEQEVRAELEKLATNPGLAVKATIGRPTYRFSFVVDRVRYHWAALFKYSPDEKAIVITQLFRIAL
jgi:hypothetical protein